MKFFEFDQNNSGGRFVIDEATGLGPRVWIEAASAVAANDRAVGEGL